MNFKSILDLKEDIAKNLYQIPKDVDLVVGIPRSGMLPALLTALALNIQVTDLQGLKEGRAFQSGHTRRRGALDVPFEKLKHALIIDDSVNTGVSMEQARQEMKALKTDRKVSFCAVYGVPGVENTADIIMEFVPRPRVFEWNVMHHEMLAYSCVDIDGVLCKDPEDYQNDDGEKYLSFLKTASTLHTPTKKINTLVTNRLEKYRKETEEWLRTAGIKYENLVMLDLPDAETRRRTNANSTFKGYFYRQDKAGLFIESELWQAEAIAWISGKPVLCMDGPVMCYPGPLNIRGNIRRLRQSEKVRKNIKDLIGPRLYGKIVGVIKK